MLTTYFRRRCGLPEFLNHLISTTSAITAMLLWSWLVCPARADQPTTVPRDDRAVLMEIARDVLSHPATGPEHSRARSGGPEATAREETVEVGTGDEPVSPVAHIGPAQQGVTVAIPPGLRRAKVISEPGPAGYHSNTGRQRPAAPRGLSFSSGVRAVGAGLDPALRADTHTLAARGRDVVYGFLLLRVPLDESLERTLAGLGVQLLGPHDNHHKARLPVAVLETIAALPEVEWVGVSSREQKQSRELAELRGPAAGAARIDGATPVPIVINLFEADRDGAFRRELEDAGVAIGDYDADLHFYRAVADGPTIDRIAALDFVQFIEPVQPTSAHHDQSMPLVDADMIRPGTTPLGLTRFGAASVEVGILDTGFMIGDAAPVMHFDLDKNACGLNFTTDAAGAFNDQNGHGTHVLATIAGSGTADPRFRGFATGVGTFYEIRAGKVLDKNKSGLNAWAESGMDFMSGFSLCESAPPLVINMSLGSKGTALTGTDSTSRKLDDKVWTYGQLYVVSAGNEGPTSATIEAPAVAKNALTVGNVFDRQYLGVGDIAQSSSRGPTGDGRMKPNLVAPGNIVTSAQAGTTNSYTDKTGTSMAAPHVTGLIATLMDHYPYLRGRPALVRSHLMATAIPHDDLTGKSNDFGLGRISGYLAHWTHPNNDGWTTHWFDGGINSFGFAYGDITVPVGTQRLVVVLTWDEPQASSGASRAVTYDLDLWADHNNDCGDPSGACGEFASRSDVDNVEYLVINNPPAGSYRLKVVPVNAPTFQLRYGMTAMIIRGDPTPAMTASLTPPATSPLADSTFEVKLSVATPSYLASGVQIQPTLVPSGLTLLSVQTRRHDGAYAAFRIEQDTLTLGNVVPTHSRQASYFFRADTPGPKTFFVRAWSENGGEVVANTTFQVQPLTANLVQTAMGTSPATPVAAPGTTFSVTDTVQNLGPGPSVSSRTRYYLSADAVKSADDTLLTGTHSVPGLDAGASHTATVTVTIPAGTATNAYFLLACADDQSAVVEDNETDNCIASPGATVTVARADLVQNPATSNPPSPVRAPGTTFSVSDSVRNAGPVPAGASITRYFLSLDGVKNAGDIQIGSRSVPGLAPGAVHSGTVTVTIPTATPLNTYTLLACADDLGAIAESDEANNCVPSSSMVTVTRPDLAQNTVSAPPATKRRGTTFTISDTVQNTGAVASAASSTRYYLSLDAVKSAGDLLLIGGRTVPLLAAGATHSGTATLTIPLATPLTTYFVLVCADGTNSVIETDEANNCAASASTVTVTP